MKKYYKRFIHWFKEFTFNRKKDYSSTEWVTNIFILIVFTFIFTSIILSPFFRKSKFMHYIVLADFLLLIFGAIPFRIFHAYRFWGKKGSKRSDKWQEERIKDFKEKLIKNYEWDEISRLPYTELIEIAKKLEVWFFLRSYKENEHRRKRTLNSIYECLY